MATHSSSPGPGPLDRPSDRELTRQVRRALGDKLELQMQPIEVDAHDGVVELRGTVATAELRQIAAEQAASAAGVREIVNHITVNGQRD